MPQPLFSFSSSSSSDPMQHVKTRGRLALGLICETIYKNPHPEELDAAVVKNLLVKHQVDPEVFVSVALLYRASVDDATVVDSSDVMEWITCVAQKFCDVADTLKTEQNLNEAEAS